MARAEPDDAAAFAVGALYNLRLIALNATSKKVLGFTSKAEHHVAFHVIPGHPAPEFRIVGTVGKRYMVSGCHRLECDGLAELLAPIRTRKCCRLDVPKTLAGLHANTLVSAQRISNSIRFDWWQLTYFPGIPILRVIH